MMKPQRGFPLRGPNTGSTGAAVKPGLSPTQASWPGRLLPCAVAPLSLWCGEGWRASSSSCQGHATGPARASCPRSCPRAGWGRVQGQCSWSGDGLRQPHPVSCHSPAALTWTQDSVRAVFEVQKRRGCPGSQAAMAVGISGVPHRPRARGLGGHVVTVEHPRSLLGPQHCHVPRSPPIPGFSEQNEVAASARR